MLDDNLGVRQGRRLQLCLIVTLRPMRTLTFVNERSMPEIRDNSRHATYRQFAGAFDTAPMGPAWLYETRKKLARASGKFGATYPATASRLH